jgi:hypothetical protein
MSGWRRLAPRLPSAALLALGLAALYKASSLPFGTVREPDSGFYPILICTALAAFAGVSFASPERPWKGESDSHPRGSLRVWGVVVAMLLYVWALGAVGFLLCTAALVLLLLRGIGALPWLHSVVAAVVAAAACYALFTRLGVPLPAGMLSF